MSLKNNRRDRIRKRIPNRLKESQWLMKITMNKALSIEFRVPLQRMIN